MTDTREESGLFLVTLLFASVVIFLYGLTTFVIYNNYTSDICVVTDILNDCPSNIAVGLDNDTVVVESFSGNVECNNYYNDIIEKNKVVCFKKDKDVLLKRSYDKILIQGRIMFSSGLSATMLLGIIIYYYYNYNTNGLC